jgi:hypothetical protein
MSRDMEYENNNIAYDEQCLEEDGGGIKCKNYELCETVLPRTWFHNKGNYLCTKCQVKFGTTKNIKEEVYKTDEGILEISDNLVCPICLEKTRCVSHRICDHILCVDCFKICHYDKDDSEN